MIRIRGAKQHNLKNINLDLPKGKISVITGPSGCGKSSLAYHTLYAEGQRRYLQCLGTKSRALLSGLEKPEFDFIDGICPAIALRQDEVRPARGTSIVMLTEVHEYLRLLYGTLGIPHDPATQEPLTKLTSSEIVTRIRAFPEHSKVMLLAPIQHSHFPDTHTLKDELRRQGFLRIALGLKTYDLEEDWELQEGISVVVDRLSIRPGVESRLADSLELVLRMSPYGAKALVSTPQQKEWEEYSFTTGYHNPRTGYLLKTLNASCFNYHVRRAQCEDCKGLGLDLERPTEPCSTCSGSRLNPAYSAVTLAFEAHPPQTLAALNQLTVTEARTALASLTIPSDLQTVIEELQTQATKRLSFIEEVGLGYLTLNQWTDELSAGEYQRIRLASQIGAGLSGVLYILDEPSRGLQEDDTQRLIKSLYRLRDEGNTVVLVEHDPRVIENADWVIDLGPGAGVEGGKILAMGTPTTIQQNPKSLTGSWLKKRSIPAPFTLQDQPPFASASAQEWLRIENATLHNLQSVSVHIPLNTLTVIHGPSGSGKSSLLTKTLAPYALYHLNRAAPFTPQAKITGLDYFSRVVVMDQSSIGRSPRSNPATYTGIFNTIRILFASLPLSKQRGYQPNRFSTNVKGGRCEKCLGTGSLHVALEFLNDAYTKCDSCHGARFNQQTLEVRYKGRNISEVLNASIVENYDHFQHHPKIAPILDCLVQVGLGYITLGQPANTLSGGEAQRIKLATELSKGAMKSTKSLSAKSVLYILDEPTRGLHFIDIETLIKALRSLVEARNTVLTIEHNEQFIEHADYEIQFGNGGGPNGGIVLRSGFRVPA